LSDATRIPLTDDAVLGLLRQHFVHADGIYVCPHVPPKKEYGARRVHVMDLPAHERVLALYDASPLEGNEGFVITARRVCWKNDGEPASSIEWMDLEADDLFIERGRLYFGAEAITISDEAILQSALDAFHVLALSGVPRATHSGLVLKAPSSIPASRPVTRAPPRSGKTEAVPPPPHTTSYFTYASHAQRQRPDCSCWRCHTPLYETTPQCAYCGALPAKTGWLRAG
jgi:hypothetical protein